MVQLMIKRKTTKQRNERNRYNTSQYIKTCSKSTIKTLKNVHVFIVEFKLVLPIGSSNEDLLKF